MKKRGEAQTTVRESLKLGGATLLSRFLGLARDILMAAKFGTGYVFDAWAMAFRLPNMFRRLLAEGAISAAFLPEFTRRVRGKGREEAFVLLRVTTTYLLLAALGLTLVIIVLAEPLAYVLCGKYDRQAAGFLLLVRLIRIVFPFLVFISLAALYMGVLNSFGHFTLPALAPAAFNICWIAGILFLCPLLGPSLEGMIIGVALAVLGGGLAQFVMQWPKIKSYGFSFGFSLDWRQPGFLEICRLMLPVLAGVAVMLLNIMVTSSLALRSGAGNFSALFYADRLAQLPLGVYAISFATVSLPLLSRHAGIEDWRSVCGVFRRGLRHVFYMILPAAAGLMLVGRPLISLLFQHGRFSGAAVDNTYGALVFLALGLPFFSVQRLVLQLFYALQEVKTTVLVGFASVVVNLGLGLALIRPMGVAGLALAISASAAFNFFVLCHLAGKKVGTLMDGHSWGAVARIVVATAVMALLIPLLFDLSSWAVRGAGVAAQVSRLVLVVSGAGGVYFSLTAWLGLAEGRELWQALRGKRAGK